MPDLIKNELKIRVSNTGIKTWDDNLELNQNSENNRLYLLCEANYDFVEVFYTWPNGRTSYIHHMLPSGYNGELNAYVFYDDIPMAVTSFTIPDVTAELRVSFTGYQKNDHGIVVPISSNDEIIIVKRVDNSQVIDQTYNGEDVPKIWTKLGELQNAMSNLDPDNVAGQIEDLQNEVTNNNININNRVDQLPTFDDVYTKKEVDDKISSLYTYKGSVATKNDLPTEGNKNGDVYTVLDEGFTYAWNGTEWIPIGNVNIDMSDYYDKTEINNINTTTNNRIDTNVTNISNLSSDLTSHKTASNSKFSTINSQIETLNTDKANKNEVYTIEEINNKFGTVYKYKGSVDTFEALPTENVENGDVYNVASTGMNYAWNGTTWDSLGTDVNLDDYATKQYVTEKIDEAIAGGSLNNYYTKDQVDAEFDARDLSITNLTGRVGTNETNIGTLQGNVTEIVNQINDLYQNDELYTQTEIDAKLADKADATTLTSEVNTLNNRITNEVSTLNSSITTNLATAKSYTDTSIAAVNETIDGIKDTLTDVYKYKGSVATYDLLPTDAATGDVWNVESDGNNYAWNGTAWDSLGAIINLEGYATTEQLNNTKSDLEEAIGTVDGKADANAANITTLDTNKANKSEVFTQSEINDKLGVINTAIGNKADANNVYTIAQADGTFVKKTDPVGIADGVKSEGKPNQTIKFTSSKDDNVVTYNIDSFRTKADSYSQTQIDNKLADKANSADVMTTQQTNAAINTAISNLVDTAPGTLDTLNELAAALGDNPNFAADVAEQIGAKADSDNVYDITTMDTKLDAKANAADVYTKDDIAGLGHLTYNDTISKAEGLKSANNNGATIKLASTDSTAEQIYTIEDATELFNILAVFEPNKYSA